MIFTILTTFLLPTLDFSKQNQLSDVSTTIQNLHSELEVPTVSQYSSAIFPTLVAPQNQVLKKLKDYKEVITIENPDYLMAFMRIPYSKKTAREYAAEVATIVKEYESYGFMPILVFEPSLNASLEKIKNGECDVFISQFFSELSSKYKMTEQQLGILVPYPEINTPAFDRTQFSPSDFSAIYNNFFILARTYYPNLRGSILLDSKSYTDDDWSNGEYASLLPYLEGIEKTYVQSFGLQGFPWMSEDGKIKLFNMRFILPMSLIQEASQVLGTKKIWLNTGTVGRMYSQDIRISPSERTQLLNSLVMYMRVLKLRGYTPFVNIFSQNNLALESENTDWSYTQSREDLMAFGEFMKRVHKSSLKVGFYDQ